ncbi:hypothetical protein H7X65_00655 [Candidatus Parcubacteria bacterium]|nr:hypothetical protein [Candidatus Parcubacteria bacterium]
MAHDLWKVSATVASWNGDGDAGHEVEANNGNKQEFGCFHGFGWLKLLSVGSGTPPDLMYI